MARRGPKRDRGQGVAVEGLAPLQRALKKAEGDAGKELKASLKAIGEEVVKPRAERYAPVGPRPKRSDSPPLAESIRVAAAGVGVSVYSSAPHAAVQDSGGRVGRDRATVLTRENASQYMTRAVRDSQADISQRLEGLLDALENDFER